jgi:hypothetical protein
VELDGGPSFPPGREGRADRLDGCVKSTLLYE